MNTDGIHRDLKVSIEHVIYVHVHVHVHGMHVFDMCMHVDIVSCLHLSLACMHARMLKTANRVQVVGWVQARWWLAVWMAEGGERCGVVTPVVAEEILNLFDGKLCTSTQPLLHLGLRKGRVEVVCVQARHAS